ncbi:MAG: hypothetical protein ACJARY_003345, partial [Candidatus Azotimanducaceae bacterium]
MGESVVAIKNCGKPMRISPKVRMLGGILVGLMLFAVGRPAMSAQTGEVEFELAQAAAREGRYREVIEILSDLLLDPELGP